MPDAHRRIRILRRFPLPDVDWQSVAHYWMRDLVGKRILDFGCGEGELLSAIDKTNFRVGVDLSFEALCEARRQWLDGIHLVRIGSDAKLPFPDRCFDCVVSTEVIEHVPDETKMLDEAWRVLTKNGRLVLTTPHRHWLSVLDLGNLKFKFPRLHRLFWVYVKRMSPADFDARYGGRSGMIGDVSVQKRPWHRHYTLRDLQELFDGRFEVEDVFIFGPFARVWRVLEMSVGRVSARSGDLIRRLDRKTRRGFSGQGYDLCVRARRIDASPDTSQGT